jgi:hypothetical protein
MKGAGTPAVSPRLDIQQHYKPAMMGMAQRNGLLVNSSGEPFTSPITMGQEQSISPDDRFEKPRYSEQSSSPSIILGGLPPPEREQEWTAEGSAFLQSRGLGL